jgi:hypothetical protein
MPAVAKLRKSMKLDLLRRSLQSIGTMTHRVAVSASAALFFAFSIGAAGPSSARAAFDASFGAAGQAKPGPPPRTPSGRPDLQGRWTNATLTPFERPAALGAKEFFTKEEAAEYRKGALPQLLTLLGLSDEAALSGEFVAGIWVEERGLVQTGRTSLVIGPTGRLPSLTPEAQKRAQARAAIRKLNLADAPEERTLGERCLWFQVGGPPMTPSIAYNSNYEIVQTPTHIAILAELGNALRIVPLDGRPHISGSMRQWQGDSRGRWEGDTLVVETTNFNDKVDAPGARPNFAGSRANVRLVERLTRVDANTLMYRFTAEDPTTWTESWTAEVPMRKLDAPLYEYACHEGNRGLENILKGARATDPPR